MSDSNKLLKFLKVDQLIEHLVGYVDTKIALTKLEIEERLKSILNNIFHFLMLIIIGASFLLFLNFGIAMLLNSYFESEFLGFIVVACFYLIFVLIFVFDKNRAISSSFIDRIFKHEDEEDSESKNLD